MTSIVDESFEEEMQNNSNTFGNWEIFADGFSGSKENTASGHADHRPCGLAQGPDGSIYVSDDSKGRIYRIIYKK